MELEAETYPFLDRIRGARGGATSRVFEILKEAIVSLERSLGTNPFDPNVHCALAEAYQKLPPGTLAPAGAGTRKTRAEKHCRDMRAQELGSLVALGVADGDDLVGCCIVVGTMLHGIATGNCLPASVPLICVDINQATVTKLMDRGSFQSMGIITDVGLFIAEVREAHANRTDRRFLVWMEAASFCGIAEFRADDRADAVTGGVRGADPGAAGHGQSLCLSHSQGV